jgi:hypothetical protein
MVKRNVLCILVLIMSLVINIQGIKILLPGEGEF